MSICIKCRGEKTGVDSTTGMCAECLAKYNDAQPGVLIPIGKHRLGHRYYGYVRCVTCGTDYPTIDGSTTLATCNGKLVGRCPFCVGSQDREENGMNEEGSTAEAKLDYEFTHKGLKAAWTSLCRACNAAENSGLTDTAKELRNVLADLSLALEFVESMISAPTGEE